MAAGYTVLYSRAALQDLLDIHDLIAADAPLAAIRFVDDIQARCDALTET